MLTTLVAKLQAWALGLLAILAVLGGAYVMGGRAARAASDKKQKLADALRASAGSKGTHDADAETNSLPSGAAATELQRDWMRKQDPKA